MGLVVSFANQKGGVAKTTSAHNIGAALAKAGKKVLLIDLDSQASLTIITGKEPADFSGNIATLLKGGKNADIRECIFPVSENLDLLPSIIDLAALEMEMFSKTNRERILDRAIAPVRGDYDFVFIDCPPQLSILTVNALSCSDKVALCVKTEYLAYRGITQLMDTVDDIRELINPRLEVFGVIATMHEPRVKTNIEILALIEKEHRVLGVVKRMAAAKKGVYDGLPVVEQDPSSDVAKEYVKIAQKFAEEASHGA
ncbi:MAG: AAA family ATPase [Eubacteriaceae bacterium]|nr:AAA family ATPase [Eubacteriaceae bacterium]